MEFQLVSQNGAESYRYTKILDEEVIIPADSTIHMNHCVLHKLEGVKFTENQSLKLLIDDVDTYGGACTSNNLTITIDEGFYTYQGLRTSIENKMTTKLESQTDQGYYNYLYSISNENIGNNTETVGTISHASSYDYENSASFDSAPIAIGVDISAENLIYSTEGTSIHVNSFYLSPNSYLSSQQVYSESDKNLIVPITYNFYTEDDDEFDIPLSINSIQAFSTAAGISLRVYAGFYGEQYATSDTVFDGPKTDGTAIVNVASTHSNSTIPTCFSAIGIESYNDRVLVGLYSAQNDPSFENVSEWVSQDNQIKRMFRFSQIDITDKFQPDDALTVGIKSYIDATNIDWEINPKTYFMFSISGGGQTYVSDSKIYSLYFQEGFFNALGYSTEIFKQSQKAFHPFFATNGLSVGAVISSDDNVLYSYEPQINGYRVAATQELSKSIGIYNGVCTGYSVSPYLYPNFVGDGYTQADTVLSYSFQDIYKLESYVVRLNNFPIQMYKTNNKKNQRGYKQAVLGIIPTPFSTLSSESVIDVDNQKYIASTYNAHYPQKKLLKNQEFVVNRFDIEITHLSDDVLAEDLDFSSINFTIEPPTPK